MVIAAKSSPVIIAKLISIFTGFVANFLLSNFFVFRSKRADTE